MRELLCLLVDPQDRKCPMRKDSQGEFRKCIATRCAWWDPNGECCTVHVKEVSA